MASYEEVLRLLRYRNWHTRSLLDRKFKLVCSELNGRYVSNEFQVEVGDWVPPYGPTFRASVRHLLGSKCTRLSQPGGCCRLDPHRFGRAEGRRCAPHGRLRGLWKAVEELAADDSSCVEPRWLIEI